MEAELSATVTVRSSRANFIATTVIIGAIGGIAG